MDTDELGLLSIAQVLELLTAEAEAERAVADPAAPDPCKWVRTSTQWVQTLTARAVNPLPIHVRNAGKLKNAHRYHPTAVRQWFAEEFERRNVPPPTQARPSVPDISDAITYTVATGILLTARALADELHMHPNTIVRRIRDYNVKPQRQTPGATWYRLGDMIGALQAGAKTEDPSSLAPQERDAHWRAEAREDEVRKNRGELIPVADAISLMNTLASALRDFYDLIPDTLEGKCGLSAEALAVVERELDDARRANAQRLREIQSQLLTARQTPPDPEADFELTLPTEDAA